MSSPFLRWWLGGTAAVGLGAALWISGCPGTGAAVVVLGAVGLGVGLGHRLGGRASGDPAAIDTLDQRLDLLRQLEGRLRAAGVSPTEEAYYELRGPAERPDPTPPTTLDPHERRLGEMIRDRCDRVWEGIGERRYVKAEAGHVADLDGAAIFAEIRDMVQEVAALYHTGSDNAVLEVRSGDVALALRLIAGELLQLVRTIPYVDLAGWSVRDIVTRLETVEKGLTLYQRLSPYEHYLTGAMLAARIAVGTSPVALAAWTLGTEGAKRVGGRLLKSRAETWLKATLESSIALVYLHVARTYDPQRVYRDPDWAALVEALRIHARIPGIDHNRKLLLETILHAAIPDEFAKLALLRSLAEDRVPDPRVAPPIDWVGLRPAERQAIATRLTEILPAMKGLNAPAAAEAVEALERRLQWGLAVDLIGSGRPDDVRVAAGLTALAAAARRWLGVDRDWTRHALAGGVFADAVRRTLGAAATDLAIRDALDTVYDGDPDSTVGEDDDGRALTDPPRDLAGTALARPYVDAFVDLLSATPAGWPIEHDHLVMLNASVLLSGRPQVTAAWTRYVAAATRRLRALGAGEAGWPRGASPAILRQLRAGEQPLAVFEAATPAGRGRWLLVCVDRVVVGTVPAEARTLDDGAPETYPIGEVRFTRRAQRLIDDLVVCCGPHRLTVAGGLTGSFERRFDAVLAPLGLTGAALPRDHQ